jgi:hypothetical protein
MPGLQEATTQEIDAVSVAGASYVSSCAWVGQTLVDVSSATKKQAALAFIANSTLPLFRVKSGSTYYTMAANGTLLSDVLGTPEICERMAPVIGEHHFISSLFLSRFSLDFHCECTNSQKNKWGLGQCVTYSFRLKYF